MRVVLGEDLTLLRDGLIRLLTAYGMEVVAAVDSGPELLRALVTTARTWRWWMCGCRRPSRMRGCGQRSRRALSCLACRCSSCPSTSSSSMRKSCCRGDGGLGYLLKDRVSDVRRFIEAVRTVAGGGTAMDPEVVSQLLARHDRDEPLGRLTPREREVLALMAEGHSNAGIASRLVVTEKAVSKHIGNIFTKLDLYPAEDANRRVLAVLTYLNG